MAPDTRISVIIPTHNGSATLAQCLGAIRSSSLAPHEIIVVDDASNDHSAEIADQFGCRVIRLSENIGAARAKNVGVKIALSEIVFFTDDDVSISPDALGQIAADLGDPAISGVVGLLTPEGTFRNFSSQYKNNWMLFSYARLPRDHIGVFYTSIAAIRREIFQGLGGFDENYRGASVAEDTEFGQRVWGAGHCIVLDPCVRATHLKHYSMYQVLATDYERARALTLMRLRKLGQPFFTSVPAFYQFAVPTLFLAFGSLALGLVIGKPLLGYASLIMFALFYILFSPWFEYLRREGGWRLLFSAVLFQAVDVVSVGAGIFIGLIDFIRGIRY